jgi:hypothetical protein
MVLCKVLHSHHGQTSHYRYKYDHQVYHCCCCILGLIRSPTSYVLPLSFSCKYPLYSTLPLASLAPSHMILNGCLYAPPSQNSTPGRPFIRVCISFMLPLQWLCASRLTASSNPHQNLVYAGGINGAKLLQLFVKKRVVTLSAIINNAIYNRTRITMVLRISVYQSLEFFNL